MDEWLQFLDDNKCQEKDHQYEAGAYGVCSRCGKER